MRIEASCGNAPHSASLNDTVYKLTLTAQTEGEKRWLAGMLVAVRNTDEWQTRLRANVPSLRIIEDVTDSILKPKETL